MALAAVVLLWHLVVRESPETLLLDAGDVAAEQVAQQRATPARLPPLAESSSWP